MVQPAKKKTFQGNVHALWCARETKFRRKHNNHAKKPHAKKEEKKHAEH